MFILFPEKKCQSHPTVRAQEGRIIDAATALHAATPQIAGSCVRQMERLKL
jgi:hypothetical protein